MDASYILLNGFPKYGLAADFLYGKALSKNSEIFFRQLIRKSAFACFRCIFIIKNNFFAENTQ